MFTILISILFGIVEGISEWLPISSTGHMILLNALIPFEVSAEFYEMYEVVIQFGAILAVVLIFWNKIFPFKKVENKWTVDKDIITLWLKIIVACIPAAVVGILFDDLFNSLFYNPGCVALALIIFGILFILVEKMNTAKSAKVLSIKDLSFQYAIYIGLFQVLAAIFPGTSRSGATIIGALLLGVARSVAAEFTFYLAIPVMAGASLLKILKFDGVFGAWEWVILLVGCLTAFLVSLVVIKKFMGYIRKHTFTSFGIYRIVVGILVLVYFGYLGILWVGLS